MLAVQHRKDYQLLLQIVHACIDFLFLYCIACLMSITCCLALVRWVAPADASDGVRGQTAIPVPGILSGFSVFSFQERTGVEFIALRRRAQVGTAGTIRVRSYRKTPIPRETRVPLLLTHSGPSLLEWVFPNWLDRVGAIGPQK